MSIYLQHFELMEDTRQLTMSPRLIEAVGTEQVHHHNGALFQEFVTGRSLIHHTARKPRNKHIVTNELRQKDISENFLRRRARLPEQV